jgi:CubicO group peptidase (beta-lactamase class C family)
MSIFEHVCAGFVPRRESTASYTTNGSEADHKPAQLSSLPRERTLSPTDLLSVGWEKTGGIVMQMRDRINQVLQQACDAGTIPGAVAMAATGKEMIYQGAFGRRDISKPAAMTQNSVFWIASMTKAITGAAAMQLVEQGKLSLDGPLGTVVPELAETQVLDGFDAEGTPRLRPPHQPITLRHLLTHTAGFCYDMWNGDMVRYLDKTGTPAFRTGLNAAMKVPIMTDPGTRWEYGTNLDFAGKAIESASGERLDAYFRDNLLAPLGMTDTGFVIGDDQRTRLVAMHSRGQDGALTSIPFEIRQDPEFFAGGGGLYGTAPDYIKFTQMILNKGMGNGHRILKPETIALMGENHIGDLNMTVMTSAVPTASNHVDFLPGIDKKYGLSFMINTTKTAEGRSAGSLAWAGLANTYYWIDPARDITGVIMMQVLPFADTACLKVFSEFESAVYAGLGAQKAA